MNTKLLELTISLLAVGSSLKAAAANKPSVVKAEDACPKKNKTPISVQSTKIAINSKDIFGTCCKIVWFRAAFGDTKV